MLSARRPPLALVAALVAAALCVLGLPGAALAATELALAEAFESPDAISVEPLVSTCASDEAVALPPEPMCEIALVDPDEDGFFAQAPLCDPSGATVIAAEPVHPIGNDRLEAPPSCDGASLLFLDRSSAPDDPAPRLLVAVDPALLPSLPLVPRLRGTGTDVGPSRLLGPAEGVRRRLEHPPHGA